MKDKEGQEIDIDLENGERIRIASTHIGEPEKALVVERAMELAALESRPGAPESEDFEKAAKELSVDARVMDRGGSVDLDGSGSGLGSTQVLNQGDGADPEIHSGK